MIELIKGILTVVVALVAIVVVAMVMSQISIGSPQWWVIIGSS